MSLVNRRGFEPLAGGLRSRCCPRLSFTLPVHLFGVRPRTRTEKTLRLERSDFTICPVAHLEIRRGIEPRAIGLEGPCRTSWRTIWLALSGRFERPSLRFASGGPDPQARAYPGVPRRNRTLASRVRSAAAEVPSAGTNWGHVRDSNPSHQSEGLAAYPRSVTWQTGRPPVNRTLLCPLCKRGDLPRDLEAHGALGSS